MIILAIETSCDDTAIAIIEKKNKNIKTLGSVVSSQDKVHEKWGGVHPSEAKREHEKNLLPATEEATRKARILKKGKVETPKNIENISSPKNPFPKKLRIFFEKYKIEKVDAVAVTIGPGLEPCLWTGVNFAQTLALYLKAPIIPVNHIKAHILSFLFKEENPDFPAVALIASGGHTELVLIKSLSEFILLGETRDDAAGECFDKTARVLGLGYPGGPAIAKKAAKARHKNLFTINLPRPMKYTKNYDFSFSGLKTAVLYDFLSRDKKTQKDENYITQMAREIEEATTDVLLFKLEKAIKNYKAKTVILGGGVTANKVLRKKVKKLQINFFKNIKFFLPPISLCTDNAQMIGAAATIGEKIKDVKKIKANANLKIYDKI